MAELIHSVPKTRSFVLLFTLFFVILSGNAWCGDLGWPDVRTRLLPDESFAVVETERSGKKHRRCPHHDVNGNLDIDQLILMLGTLDEIEWLSKNKKKSAQKHLERHYDHYLNETEESGSPNSIDINRDPLRKIVLLPGIGPVLAVRIYNHRENQGLFSQPEDIQHVDGIGKNTYRAIRHYITCK